MAYEKRQQIILMLSVTRVHICYAHARGYGNSRMGPQNRLASGFQASPQRCCTRPGGSQTARPGMGATHYT